METRNPANRRVLEVQLPHYESLGYRIFAAVEEGGRTIATGNGEKMRETILGASQHLYLYTQH